MEQFSISQLGHFSGIQPHTIRIWEQRYGALTPSRSKGNTRYYDNSQLKRLLNIVSLLDSSNKVSALCALSDEKLSEMILDKQQDLNNSPDQLLINQMILAGMTYDENYFDKIFSQAVMRFGMEETYSRFIKPFLIKLGLLWCTNVLPPAQEHFLSGMIRIKLSVAIDSLPNGSEKSNTWLLLLPENEFHEIGLLWAYYLIRKSGNKVVYLGASTPVESLMEALEAVKPQNVLIFMVQGESKSTINEYIEYALPAFKGKNFCIAGDGSKEIKDKKIKFFKTEKELESFLKN